jgi:hypothetical protein
VAERFGSGGSEVGAVELRDCLPGRRGHADELAISVRLRRHVAPAPWPASLLDEPVPAVELCNLRQQPGADLGVQRRLDPPVGLRFPSVDAVHRERERRGHLVARLAGQSTRCHKCGALVIERDRYRLGTWRLTSDGLTDVMALPPESPFTCLAGAPNLSGLRCFVHHLGGERQGWGSFVLGPAASPAVCPDMQERS